MQNNKSSKYLKYFIIDKAKHEAYCNIIKNESQII